MQRIDHAAMALDLLDALDRGLHTGVEVIAAAQVHATLYLAEQQRVANILALHTAQPESPYILRDNMESWAQWPDIAAALGLNERTTDDSQ